MARLLRASSASLLAATPTPVAPAASIPAPARPHPRSLATPPCCAQATDGAVLSLIAALLSYFSILIGHRLGMELAARLFMQTFLLVAFGAQDGQGGSAGAGGRAGTAGAACVHACARVGG